MKLRPKLAMIKLAAIGDVALASRAVRDLDARFEADAELHWIIDRELAPLAQALLDRQGAPRHIRPSLHPIDGRALFQGSAAAKAGVALAMARELRAIRPDHVILLHRDWRYRAAIFTGYRGHVTASPVHVSTSSTPTRPPSMKPRGTCTFPARAARVP